MTLLTDTPTPQRPPTPDEVREGGRSGNGAGGDRQTIRERRKRSTHLWARRLHVYTSMLTLVIVLFFGVTGLTLNHPSWTFGDETSTETVSGTFPFAMTDDSGAVQFLSAAEYVRSEHGVSGSVANFQAQAGEGSIAFKNAGYSADLFFDTETGAYDLTVTQQGFVAVMNDLHKGRDTSRSWSWVIDLSAGFLVVISVTGLVMQLFLKKRRRAALLSAAAGTVITIGLIVFTLVQ